MPGFLDINESGDPRVREDDVGWRDPRVREDDVAYGDSDLICFNNPIETR